MPRNSARKIALLAKMAADNADSRIELTKAFELGLISFEEFTAEHRRLDSVLCVLIAEEMGKGASVQVEIEPDFVIDPGYVFSNQAN